MCEIYTSIVYICDIEVFTVDFLHLLIDTMEIFVLDDIIASPPFMIFIVIRKTFHYFSFFN